MTAGYEIYVKKTDNNSNAITITPNGSDKIDGASSYVLERSIHVRSAHV